MKNKRKKRGLVSMDITKPDSAFLSKLKDQHGYASKTVVLSKLIKLIKLHKMENELK